MEKLTTKHRQTVDVGEAEQIQKQIDNYNRLLKELADGTYQSSKVYLPLPPSFVDLSTDPLYKAYASLVALGLVRIISTAQ